MKNIDIEKTTKYLIEHLPAILSKDLIKIVLYGSCARGNFTDDSDIDIALITRCDRKEAKKYDEKLMDVVTDIAMNIGTIVEYACIPLSEYNEKKRWYGYFKNIENEGVVLYG